MTDLRILVTRTALVAAMALVGVIGAVPGSAAAQKCYDVVGDEMFETSCSPSPDLGPDD